MIFNIIFMFTGLIIFATVWGTMMPAAKPRKNILFGVTLPSNALEDERVKEIQRNYIKISRFYVVTALILFFMTFTIRQYLSLFITAFLIWTFGFIAAMEIPYKRMNKRLMKLKKENDWYVGQKKRVLVDTVVSRLKNTMVIPIGFFLIPAAIAFVPVAASFMVKNKVSPFADVIAYVNLLLVLLFVGCYISFRNMKTKGYSQNSDINMAANKVHKMSWSIIWFYGAFCHSLMSLLTYFYLQQLIVLEISGFITLMSILIAFTLGGLGLIYKKGSDTEDYILASDQQEIYTDDDEYWIDGIHYYNPNDNSFMVNKRFGIGSTVNLAKKSGKRFAYGGSIMAGVLMVMLCGYLIVSDFTVPVMKISEYGKVDIKYISYNYSFVKEHIEDVTLIDELPSAIKTNGIGTNIYSRGKYYVEGYGTVNLYIYNKSKPFVVVKLKDHYVIYNEKSTEKTMEVYDQLQQLTNK